MADSTARNRALAAPARLAPATPASPAMLWDDDEDDPPFDPATFDPTEFEWRPVPRRARADGWTPEVQCAFIQALADTGMVEQAAQTVDRSVQSAYRLRRAPGGESFARAWSVALRDAAERVLDLAFARAIEGEDTPVFDRDGCRIGSRRKVNDRMTMFLLRAYMPDRFRHAPEDTRRRNEPQAPQLPSLDQALSALMPPPPVDPHLLVEPAKLEGLVRHARDMAAVDEMCPPDDTEHYAPPRAEQDHPAAMARSLRRHRPASLEDAGP
jgi:hypothetical protein